MWIKHPKSKVHRKMIRRSLSNAALVKDYAFEVRTLARRVTF